MKLLWSLGAMATAWLSATDVADAAAGTVEAVVARDFKSKLSQYDASLVEFYAPWCGHCKSLEPKYGAAAELLAAQHASLNVALFKADAVSQQALTAKYGIESYPTIKLFYGTTEVEKYEGERETDAIAQFLVDKAATAAQQQPARAVNAKPPRGGAKNGRNGGNNNNNKGKKAAAAAGGGKKNRNNNKRKGKNGGTGGNRGGNKANNRATAVRSATPVDEAGEDEQLSKAEKAEMWREQIGRSTWHLLHSMAAKFPDKPTEAQQAAAINFVQSLQELYPCDKCRLHLNQKMGTSAPLVSSRKAFSSWVCMLHNLVNEDKGKEHFDCTLKHLDEVYLKDCDGCVVHGSVEDLSENAVEFGAVAPAHSAKKASPNANAAQAAAARSSGGGGGVASFKQEGTCSIAQANTHRWLQADTERTSSDLTDGKLTIVFFNAVTCHVCHEIHPVLKQLHSEFAARGLNIISVHHTIYGDMDAKLESQAIDYHALEELQYPILAHQQTATTGEDDRVALPNSLFYMTMQRDGFGVPAMAVLKDCKTVWRGMGFQLKQINDWVRAHADQYLAPATGSSGGHGEL